MYIRNIRYSSGTYVFIVYCCCCTGVLLHPGMRVARYTFVRVRMFACSQEVCRTNAVRVCASACRQRASQSPTPFCLVPRRQLNAYTRRRPPPQVRDGGGGPSSAAGASDKSLPTAVAHQQQQHAPEPAAPAITAAVDSRCDGDDDRGPKTF